MNDTKNLALEKLIFASIVPELNYSPLAGITQPRTLFLD